MTDGGSSLMAWSRRLIFAFWAMFLWLMPMLLLKSLGFGPHIHHENLIMIVALSASAVLVGFGGIVLRNLARYVEAHVRDLAYTDALTGLPNRAFLMQRLDGAIASSKRTNSNIAVLFVDVDRFKVINDSLGHSVGDEALVEVTRRFESCIRPYDTLARFGGDEFVLLLGGGSEDTQDATRFAARLIESLTVPLHVGGQDLRVTASVGIAVANPGTSSSSDLLRDADLALYRAKAQGRCTYVLFNTDMTASALEQLHLETDLWRASERGELKLVYQPEFSVDTGDLVGFEALLRWNHPTRGVLMPSHFINIAEENGSLIDIGLWVIASACYQMCKWQQANPQNKGLEMSINLSARQLEQEGFAEQVKEILDKSGLNPACVRLEVTESILVRDNNSAIATLWALKNLGVRLAIDDFGTGYSSLSYLKLLPIDAIKIDQSFVVGLDKEPDESNLLLVQGIVTIAHDLGLYVTAEGIETEGQLTLLRNMGCDRAQGYHFATPLSSDVVDALIKIRRTEAGVSAVA